MASFTYNAAKVSLAKAEIDWVDDTIKVALCTTSYVPNKDTHQYFSDITNEVSGGGYTAGGYTLAGRAVTQDDTNDRAILDANDNEITGLTATFRYGVVYQDTGVASTSRLIAVIDLDGGENITLTDGRLNITWNTDGVLYIR